VWSDATIALYSYYGEYFEKVRLSKKGKKKSEKQQF
jgi:hypothetical protein